MNVDSGVGGSGVSVHDVAAEIAPNMQREGKGETANNDQGISTVAIRGPAAFHKLYREAHHFRAVFELQLAVNPMPMARHGLHA